MSPTADSSRSPRTTVTTRQGGAYYPPSPLLRPYAKRLARSYLTLLSSPHANLSDLSSFPIKKK